LAFAGDDDVAGVRDEATVADEGIKLISTQLTAKVGHSESAVEPRR